jgi:FlaA1/EpsC-like NDP-sugar epimerase
MKTRLVLISALATALITGNAFACGDSLYRVGKGVSYRVYTAPLPGSVLVYGAGEGAETLAKELARSGHGVRLVSNNDDLQSELGSGAYDVVIAAYSEQSAVMARTHSAAGSPTFLPVALTEDEGKQARTEHERVMLAEQDEIKHYLKAIHQTLKQRG